MMTVNLLNLLLVLFLGPFHTQTSLSDNGIFKKYLFVTCR